MMDTSGSSFSDRHIPTEEVWYPLIEDFEARAGNVDPMQVKNVTFRDGSCYLNGSYSFATPFLPNLNPRSFGVSVQFKPEAESYWIVVGGAESYWFGLQVVGGHLAAMLNNQRDNSELAGKVTVDTWHTVTACVDISKRLVEVTLDGKSTIRWDLRAGLALDITPGREYKANQFLFQNPANQGVFKGKVKNLHVFEPFFSRVPTYPTSNSSHSDVGAATASADSVSAKTATAAVSAKAGSNLVLWS